MTAFSKPLMADRVGIVSIARILSPPPSRNLMMWADIDAVTAMINGTGYAYPPYTLPMIVIIRLQSAVPYLHKFFNKMHN